MIKIIMMKVHLHKDWRISIIKLVNVNLLFLNLNTAQKYQPPSATMASPMACVVRLTEEGSGRGCVRGRWGSIWILIFLNICSLNTSKGITSIVSIQNIGPSPGWYWEHPPFWTCRKYDARPRRSSKMILTKKKERKSCILGYQEKFDVTPKKILLEN